VKATEAAKPQKQLMAALVVGVAVVYFFSNPKPQSHYDYTFRVASLFLQGHISPAEQPGSWLNEFVPFEGGWYSVFPLGAVLSMIPFAALKAIGLITDMPSAFVYSLLAGVCCLLMLLIASRYNLPPRRQILLTLAILFGTFTWTNLTMGGAWQLALGFAMVGELGAIWFTVFDRRPLVAGIFFAIAFGNRTEILLTAPLFFYLLYRGDPKIREGEKGRSGYASITRIATFCAVPFVLGVATLVYNQVRFHSFTDFGYARIPGVLNEPWYNHGIFSTQYIPRQAWEMLLKLWETRLTFPYIVPNAFSGSILLSSPFLFLTLRTGARDGALKLCAWTAIVIMTVLLWMHGNSGGWQFGYRYAMGLLPWVFVILLEGSPKKITPLEWALYIFSFAANAYATWLFNWTSYPHP